MKFKVRLLQGALIKRYKRFFIDIKYKKQNYYCSLSKFGFHDGAA